MCSQAVPPPPRLGAQLGGLTFHELDEDGVVRHVLDSWRAGRGGWLVNPNVDVLRQVSADPDVLALASSADLVVADGVPLLWAARLIGEPLPGLVAGSELIWSLSRAALQSGVPVFLLGAAEGVAEKASLTLTQAFGGRPPGYYSPPFGFERDSAALDEVRRRLREHGSAVVFCGFGFPKQERLMSLLSPEFPENWFIGTGASIAFVGGDVRRAPGPLRGSGFEWAFRLAVEPRRLFKRYVVLDAPYAVALLTEAARGRRRRRVR